MDAQQTVLRGDPGPARRGPRAEDPRCRVRGQRAGGGPRLLRAGIQAWGRGRSGPATNDG